MARRRAADRYELAMKKGTLPLEEEIQEKKKGISFEEKEVFLQAIRSLGDPDEKNIDLEVLLWLSYKDYGMVRITGENLLDMTVERTNEEVEDALEEKFLTTWYYGEKEKQFYSSGKGRLTEDGKLKRYDQRGSEWLYLEKGIDTYYLEVKGFERRFTLKIVEPRKVETPEELGYSQTKNDTTITARAAIVNDMIELEYYMIPSTEVRMAMESRMKYFIMQMPYQFDMEERQYVETAAGERMKPEKYRNMKSGMKLWYKGSEEDFPLTFHYPTLTGTNEERFTIDLPLPEDVGTMTENLPKLHFKYGTVEILSITRENGAYKDGNLDNPQVFPAAKVDLVYHVIPKDGQLQMYRIGMDIAEEKYGSEGLDAGEDYATDGWTIYLKDMDSQKMTVTFCRPSFWIVGDYDIVIEKPADREDTSSAIDEESNTVYTHFSIG